MEVVPHTDAGAFARLAHPLLEPDPVRHTSILTVLDGVRTGAFDPTAMLTVHENGGVVGALLRTAGHPALVSAVPPRCAGAVVEALVARDPEVEGDPGAGRGGRGRRRRVVRPDRGRRHRGAAHAALRARRARRARRSRRDGPRRRPGRRRAGWTCSRSGATEFDREIGRTWRHPHTARDDVVRAVGTGAGEIVWEVDGEPVAQAAARAVVAGMSRIGPVYTPPEHRGRGYAAAVTAAAARWALGSGARHVLLYTDLANPTTNRLYPRLGFRPRYDALELRFVCPDAGATPRRAG